MYSKLPKVLGILDAESNMFISTLINIKMQGEYRVDRHIEYNTTTPHNILCFLSHYINTNNVNQALKYLSVEEYKVAEAILSNNLFPTVELLGGIDRLLQLRDVQLYVEVESDVPLFYQVHDVPFSFIEQKSKNLVELNGAYFAYDKQFKDYFNGTATLPVDLFSLHTTQPKVEGKYVTTYTLSGLYTIYMDYQVEIIRATDWVIDDAYEIAGVKFIFRGKDYIVKGDIPKNKKLTDIWVEVKHTKRGTLKSSKISID